MNILQNIIQERCMQDPEIISSSSPRPIGVPPDTLYMLKNQTIQSSKIDGENGFEYDTSKLPGMNQNRISVKSMST